MPPPPPNKPAAGGGGTSSEAPQGEGIAELLDFADGEVLQRGAEYCRRVGAQSVDALCQTGSLEEVEGSIAEFLRALNLKKLQRIRVHDALKSRIRAA